MSLENFKSSSVRFFVFQSKDMALYPELQAAYPASILTDNVGMDSSHIKIKSVYPFRKAFQQLLRDLPTYEEEYFVFFLENFYHSSVYVLQEFSQLAIRIPDKKVIVHSLKMDEYTSEMLMKQIPCIDMVVRTDLEQVFQEVLVEGKGLTEISNLTIKVDGKVFSTEKADVTRDLSYLPPAYLNGIALRDKDNFYEISQLVDEDVPGADTSLFYNIPKDLYLNWLEIVGNGRDAMLTTGRGCKYKCAYCFRGVKFSTLRQIPLDNVRSDMHYLKSKGFRRIYFYDDCFLTTNYSRLDEVLSLLREFDFEYYIAVRHEICSVEIMEKLKGIKFYKIQIGLQTVKDLPNMRRKANVEKFSEVMKTLNSNGANTSIDIILGLPGDTPQDFKDTVEFALSLSPSCIVVNTLFINPSTVLGATFKDYGIKVKRVPLNVPYIVSSDTFSPADLDDCREFVKMKMVEQRNISFILR